MCWMCSLDVFPTGSGGAARCGSIGGGLGDALVVADRVGAEALSAVAPAVQGCHVEADDAGSSREQVEGDGRLMTCGGWCRHVVTLTSDVFEWEII